MNNIEILDKKECTGCQACKERCPKHCVTMQSDSEGFLYPVVDIAVCVNCGLCRKVCHELHPFAVVKPMDCLAVKVHNENIRVKSSSGGMFTLLATYVLNKGGVVFGARFDNNWQVIMDYTESLDGLGPFRGSKYIQASNEGAFTLVEKFLKEGRVVLYTGTHCQIAALRRFLGKEYEHLLAVDFLCHGVPSPLLWHKYIKEITSDNISIIKAVSFRKKSVGWKKFQLSIQMKDDTNIEEIFSDNLYMKAFLSDMSLRPSCYHCKSRNGCSGSDITIGDHWAIQSICQNFDDDKGTSMVLVNTEKGICVWNILNEQTDYIRTDFEDSKNWNGAFYLTLEEHLHRKEFFAQLTKRDDVSELIIEELKITIWDHVKKHLKKKY